MTIPPGPWRAQVEIEAEFALGPQTPRITKWQIYTATGKFAHIATCKDEATACFLTAAPEMHEALQMLQDEFCSRHCINLDGEHFEECTMASTALAKAHQDSPEDPPCA